MIELSAHGKINLALEVLGKRADGYHDILSVVQLVDLHDTLVVEPSRGLELECQGLDLPPAANLAWQAASELRKEVATRYGAKITIVKGIPVASGLGGGSSDAAATLLGLNQLWRLGLSRSELHQIASQLGSDVPYFLYGGTALISGRGEQVELLPKLPPFWVLLIKPRLEIPDKTQQLYNSLTPQDYSDGDATMALAEAIRQKQYPLPNIGLNAFERILLERYPEVGHSRDELAGLGASAVGITGAGPTVYGLWKDEFLALQAYERSRAAGLSTYLSRTINPED